MLNDCEWRERVYWVDRVLKGKGRDKPSLCSSSSWRSERNLWGHRCLLQRGIVDDEAVFHILLQQTVIGLVDLLYADLLDVRRDAVLAAEIEHLLRLAYAANRGTRQAPSAEEQVERIDGQRLFRRSHQAHRSVAAQQIQVSVDVMLCRDAIQNKVEAARVLQHRVRVLRDHHLVSAQPLRVMGLARGSGKKHHMRAQSMRKLQSHVTEPA